MAALRLTACTVDLERRQVVGFDAVRTLSTKEAQLLAYLVEHAGGTVSQEQLLVEVWGYSADSLSGTVYTTITRLRAKIEAEPSNPQHVVTVFGEGYRFEPGVALAPTPRPSTNLAPALDGFFGRGAELVAIDRARGEGARLLTLTGVGGAGKSRLAREYARAAAPNLAGGAWFCDLSGASSAAGICHVVAEALGVGQTRGEPVAHIEQALTERGPALLVLDNFEHLTALAADTVGRWLPACPALTVIATSRSPLHIGGERRLRVEPLPVPRPGDPLHENAAVRLFFDRARAVDHRFSVPDRSLPEVGHIVAELDGLPLAIELAAPWVAVLELSEIRRRLDQRFRLLANPNTAGRHATLEATIAWTWDRLAPWERVTLAQCSVFEGGFTVDAAEAVVCLEAHPDAPWIPGVLQSLGEQNLIRRDKQRLGMLVSIRAFAARWLEGVDGRLGAERRHGAYFRDLKGALATRSLALLERRQRCRQDLDNLVAALRRAAERADPETAIGAYQGVAMATWLSGPSALQHALGGVLLGMASLSPQDRAEALMIRAHAAWLIGWLPRAQTDIEGCLALMAECGSADRLRVARHFAHGIANVRGDWARSIEGGEASLADADEETPYVAAVLINLAFAYANVGRFDAAHTASARNIALCARQGWTLLEAYASGNRAVMHLMQGEIETARAEMERCLAVAQAFEDLRYEGYMLHKLGDTYRALGDLAAAELCLRDSRALFQRGDFRINEAKRLCSQGALHVARGERPRAQACLSEARRLAEGFGVLPASDLGQAVAELEQTLARRAPLALVEVPA